MAELADVENALVCTLAQAVYPNGTAASSATGTPVRIYRGWPLPAPLDADLKAGVVNISVFPLDQERNLTKNPLDWIELPQPPVYLAIGVSGDLATVSGRVTCPLNAGLTVKGIPYIYPLQATDTPASVATALAAMIPGATSSGADIVLPPGSNAVATVGAVGNIVQEIRRQQKSFRISLWCPSPATRDALAAVADSALANLSFVNLPDGTSGRIRYERTQTMDGVQKSGLYRRDLVYTVEYSTTNVTIAAAVISLGINVSGGTDLDGPPLTTVNV